MSVTPCQSPACKRSADQANDVLSYMATLGAGFRGASAAELGGDVWVPPEWSGGRPDPGGEGPRVSKPTGCQRQGPGCASRACNECADMPIEVLDYMATLGDGIARATPESVLESRMGGGCGSGGAPGFGGPAARSAGPVPPAVAPRLSGFAWNPPNLGFDTDGAWGLVPTFDGALLTRGAAESLVACTGRDLLGWGVVPESGEYAYVVVGESDRFSLYVLGQYVLGESAGGRPSLCGREVLTRIDASLVREQSYCSGDHGTVYAELRWTFEGYRAPSGGGGLDWVFSARLAVDVDVANSTEDPEPLFRWRGLIRALNQSPAAPSPRRGAWDVELQWTEYRVQGGPPEEGLRAAVFNVVANCATHEKLAGCDTEGFAGAPSASISNVFSLIVEDGQDAETGRHLAGLFTAGSSTAFDPVVEWLGYLFAELPSDCPELEPSDPPTHEPPEHL